MRDSSTGHRLVARAIAAILWIVGSAYLIKAELAHTNPDLIIVIATPVIWLAVISMPILVAYAMHDRQYVAAALLTIAALIGSAYTLSGTIGRQAESRDVTVATAAADKTRRAALQTKMEAADVMLGTARARFADECRTGKGKKCEGIQATIDVYEGAVAGYEHKLSQLTTRSPRSGEQRIAAMLATIPALKMSAAELEPVVGLWAPVLIGLFLEIGALGAAFVSKTRRAALQTKMEAADVMLGTARARFADECRTGKGKKCEGIQATIDVYEGAVAGYEHKLSQLPRLHRHRYAGYLAGGYLYADPGRIRDA